MSSPRIKILYIGLLPPEAGGRLYCGTAVHGWQLAQQASQRGYEVYFLASTRYPSSSFVQGITIVNLPGQRFKKALWGLRFYGQVSGQQKGYLKSFPLREKVSILGRSFFLGKLLARLNPHLVHVHGIENSWTFGLKANSPSLPIIITDHGFWHNMKGEKDLAKIRQNLEGVRTLIPVSEFCRRQEEENQLNFQGLVKIIHNPIESGCLPFVERGAMRRKLGWDSNKNIIFFCGVIESLRIKGLDILLASYAANDELKKSSRLLVIADREGARFARKFVGEKNLDGLIFEPQPREKVIDFYNAADIFVMPSRSEAFPLVYEESLLAGVPVIGFSDVVRELENILEIDIGDKFDARQESPNDLSWKIIRLLKRSFDRQSLRNKVIEKLSWEAQFQEYDSLYRSLLACASRGKGAL